MTTAAERTKLFISYSHKDTWALERLQVFLKPLEREGLVDRWDDTRLRTGQRWKEEIRQALESARVAILLISQDFLASDFISEDELPPLLAAAESEGVVIMPVILKPCQVRRYPELTQFQMVNSPDSPLSAMNETDQERLWLKLSEDIERTLHRP